MILKDVLHAPDMAKNNQISLTGYSIKFFFSSSEGYEHERGVIEQVGSGRKRLAEARTER